MKKKKGAKVIHDKMEMRICRSCGCSDQDCSLCIERTGHPCSWVECDLCSACTPSMLKKYPIKKIGKKKNVVIKGIPTQEQIQYLRENLKPCEYTPPKERTAEEMISEMVRNKWIGKDEAKALRALIKVDYRFGMEVVIPDLSAMEMIVGKKKSTLLSIHLRKTQNI